MSRGIAGSVLRRVVMGMLALVACETAVFPGPIIVSGVKQFIDAAPLDPSMQEKVEAALSTIKETPDDIAAIEVLLSVDPRVVGAVETNQIFLGGDSLRGKAVDWSQSLQPVEVLVACLDKGSDAAVHWALRQISWKWSNGGYDEKNLARLMPGIERTLVKAAPATRAQAAHTLTRCLPFERRQSFLQGLLKGQPDEVIAAAIEELAPRHEINPEIEVIGSKWLKKAEAPVLLNACCSYWWLAKGRQSEAAVKADEIAPFERLAAHADATVRSSVTRALSGETIADQPHAVAILLRLTSDKDPLVQWHAVRSLRHANTPEVNARLREIFAAAPPLDLRAVAIEVLGVFGKENLPLLVQAAKTDPEPAVRQNAVYALRMIGTPDAGAALEVAAKDADKNVQREAREQLGWYRKEHPKKP